jgi:hypothetical protein
MFSAEHAGTAFASYWSLVYPWMKNMKAQAQEKMHEVMKKWTGMGAFKFEPVAKETPLHQKAKQMQVPDDFKAKLRARLRERKRQ